jgi:hypothetical protein
MFFKSVDEKLEKRGFKKVKDNQFIVSYTRYNNEHEFTQNVDICHKATGHHIIQSYDSKLFDQEGIGNTCVGLTYSEIKLFAKKMKQKKWLS